jgi:uncharacterized protein (UPF0332 family)
VTPEAADYLAKAREYLNKARSLLDVKHYSDEAARAAYLAAFHAAQALVFERTARVAKSHSGLRTTFARLAKDDPRIDRPFTRFLARVYAGLQVQGNHRLWYRSASSGDRSRSAGDDRPCYAVR